MLQSTILVVDDVKQNLSLMAQILEMESYRVFLAGNGAEALEIVRQTPVDLIITDIMMPVMDGYSLCREVKADSSLNHIPIIIYSATFTASEDENLALGLGAARFMLKPISLEVVRKVVAEVLSENAGRPVAGVKPTENLRDNVCALHTDVLSRKLGEKIQEMHALFKQVDHLDGNKNILLVDDDVDHLEMMAEFVSSMDFAFDLAPNGLVAVEALKNKVYDIVISDMIMPGMDGMELLKHIKSKHQITDVIIVTGYSEKYSYVDFIDAGASDFIAKPFMKQEFAAKLYRVLREQELILEYRKEIIERQEVEAALRKSEGRFRDVSLSMADWIWEVDRDGKYMFASGKVEEILGYSPEQIIGKTPFDLMERAEAERVGSIFQEIVAAQNPIVDMENWMLHRDGTKVCFLTNGVPLLDESGGLLGYRGVDKDISLRKQIEEKEKCLENEMKAELERLLAERSSELAQMQSQLFQTSKLAILGEMATGLAHEINQPLSGIAFVTKGFEKLIEKQKLTEEELEIGIKDINDSILRITKIIKHIRTFARQGEIDKTEFDLNATVLQASGLLGEQMRQHSIDLVLELDASLPKVIGDPFQLEQVWINFLTNARDALLEKEKESGAATAAKYQKRIIISTRCHQEVTPAIIELQIKDNGVGLSEEAVKKIFEPFYTSKEVDKGTGLGLSISLGIVEGHGGKIKVESRLGEGSQFTVLLPI